MLKTSFWIAVAVWIVGGLVGLLVGSSIIRDISINIGGSIACVLGLILLGRWAWRKITGEGPYRARRLGRGLTIVCMNAVPANAVDPIEKALQKDAFHPKGRTSDGAEVIMVRTPGDDWLAVVEVSDDLIVRSAYRVESNRAVAEQVAELVN